MNHAGQLELATDRDIDELMTWFPDAAAVDIWGGPKFRFPFTRDSFVMYLTEKVEGERKELGYAFTHPEADRIGMNLKWILVLCYMTSNRDATPSM